MRQSVRGTHDLLPEVFRQHEHIQSVAFRLCRRFGFESMATPILEYVDVFKRTLGESSDIIAKEMYCFTDRGGEELVLRPEGTAGVVRAFVSEGLSQRSPLKVSYSGPMFRYERPQKGRLRQFHQFGVELLGSDSLWADVEVVLLAVEILRELGIWEKTELAINSIGDLAARETFKNKFLAYLAPLSAQLSEDSQKRIKTNPLRILDSKHDRDQDIVASAPRLLDELSSESRAKFEWVTQKLSNLGVNWVFEPRLVRGLDYYNDLVFEFRTQHLGSQDAVCAGGRYDTLVQQMGGPSTPAVGWAMGIERLVLLSQFPEVNERTVAVIPVHPSMEEIVQELTHTLRREGLCVESFFSGNMSKRMKKAHTRGVKWVVVVGPDEHSRGHVMLKDLDTGAQSEVALKNLMLKLKKDSSIT